MSNTEQKGSQASNFNERVSSIFTIPTALVNSEALANAYYNYEKVEEISSWIAKRMTVKPMVAIICGSGLGEIADRVINPQVIPYADIPEFPRSTVLGHKGNLVFGTLGELPVVCMQGRFHGFEGYPLALCTLPVRIFKFLGCKMLLLTNAAGGINKSYHVGDLMLIKDHVSFPMLSLTHPLVGPNDERFGPRFVPVNNIYCKKLRAEFKACADELKISIKEGVYTSVGGPSYETVSDIRLCEAIGADAVGMSTAHESTVATHAGLKVLAFSIITDMVVLEFDSEETTDHLEIVKVANLKAKEAEELVISFLRKVSANPELMD